VSGLPGAAAPSGGKDGESQGETVPLRAPADCTLCSSDGGEVVVRSARWRVILAGDADYPPFTRVIWRAHMAEMSDLSDAERRELFDVVLAVERVQRDVFAPDKINWAAFGNMVPHLHWHVIPRWRDDRHFPESVWGKPADAERDAAARARAQAVAALLPRYRQALAERLAG